MIETRKGESLLFMHLQIDELLANLARHHQARPDRPDKMFGEFAARGLGLAGLHAIKSPVSKGFPYARRVIASTDVGEIMLAHWTAGHECAPHDHGFSSGYVFFLEGDFAETSYTQGPDGLYITKKTRYPEGSFSRVTSGEIHSCICSKNGLSLHVYFPRIEGMRVYDVENRRTLVVSDDCGAWVPENLEQINEEHPWKTKKALLSY